MKTEKSCGAVVFTRAEDGIKYVIIEQQNGVVGFPKGHVEGDETEKETALREISEEVGLTVRLTECFRTEESHMLPGADVRKLVVYFLAEYEGQTPRPQESEVGRVRVVPFDEAMRLVNFESSKRILMEADEFLERRAEECQKRDRTI